MKPAHVKPGQTDTIIFTTGAFLKPIKLTEHGRDIWRWVVVSFEDDSYHDGELINPQTAATRADKLLEVFADD